jgi:hypothetical protein
MTADRKIVSRAHAVAIMVPSGGSRVAGRLLPRFPARDRCQVRKELDIAPIAYVVDEERQIYTMSTDVVEAIRSRYPDFQPSAYLNSTERPDHFKWVRAVPTNGDTNASKPEEHPPAISGKP